MINKSIVFLARKYLSGRKTRGIGKAHYLCLIGITLGVLSLLCVTSVMNGFRFDIRNRITGTFAEIRISAKGGETIKGYSAICNQLQDMKFSASPVIRNELLLKYDSVVLPTLCFGIEPNRHKNVSSLLQKPDTGSKEIIQGLLVGNISPEEFSASGIALGAGLASQLGVYLGDEIQVLSPMFNVPTAFGMIPHIRFLKVQAIFAAGMPEYDQNFSFMSIDNAVFFASYSPGEADYIEVKPFSQMRKNQPLKTLKKAFPDFQIEDWSSFDPNLYSAIRFEKFLMFVIMLFMFIIASFNLTGNLLKMISQKKRELGLLKALGLTDKDLQSLFLVQALFLCSAGIILGFTLGSLLLLIQKYTGIVKLSLGGGNSIILPVKFAFTDYLLITVVAYLITILSVLLPLKRLNKINAVELIKRAV